MTDYWVQIIFSAEHVTLPDNAPTNPVGPALVFGGVSLADAPSPDPIGLVAFCPFSFGINGYWATDSFAGGFHSAGTFTDLDLDASIGQSFVVGSQPDPTPSVAPTATATVYDYEGRQLNTLTYETFEWILVGDASDLVITPTDAFATVALTKDDTGSITSPSQTGQISFSDTDTSTTPTGSIDGQTATATDSNGNAIPLSTDQISALEAAFTISAASGNTNDGSIDWTYNAQAAALASLTTGETALVTSTIGVSDQDGNTGTATVTITVIGPGTTLFSNGSDTVDFNNLTADQIAAINGGAQLYNTLDGDDTVALPNQANDQLTSTVAWDPLQTFTTGDGNDTISGGDGNYIIALGNGANTVTINGNGDNTITSGTGDTTVSLSGAGQNTLVGNSDGAFASVTVGASDALDVEGQATATNFVVNGDVQVSGALTITGELSGAGSITVDAGATLTLNASGDDGTVDIVTDDGSGTVVVDGQADISDDFVVNGNIQDNGSLTVDGTTSGSGTITLGTDSSLTLGAVSPDENLTVVFEAVDAPKLKLEYGSYTNPSPAVFNIQGFSAGDTIDFEGESNLTTSAPSGTPPSQPGGQLEVYSGAHQVATLNFASSVGVDYIEPKNTANGTELFVEGNAVGPQQVDPTGTLIDWNYIHQHEGFEIAPYVPSNTSGVTIGYGADLAASGITPQYFRDTIFPSYSDDQNLVTLYGAIVSTLRGNLAKSYLKNGGQTITIDRNVASKYVTVTTAQADKITYYVELFKLSTGPGTLSVTGFWNKYAVKAAGTVPFNGLPPIAQTALYGLFYNGLITYNSKIMSSFVAAAKTVSQQNSLGSSSAWAQVATALFTAGGTNSARKIDDGSLIEKLIIQSAFGQEQQSPSIPTSVSGEMVGPDASDYSFSVASSDNPLSQGDLVDPFGHGTYVLTTGAGSPAISTLTLPTSAANAYAISFEQSGGTWSTAETVQALQTVTVPTGTSSIQVQMLNADGSVDTNPSDLTFDVTFASSGAANVTVTAPTPATMTPSSPLYVSGFRSSQTGEAGAGATVTLTLSMGEAVIVNTSAGSPSLALDDGETATYDAQASNPANGTLVFDYTVAAGDSSPNLYVTEVDLNGATVTDASGNAADFSNALNTPAGLQIGAAALSSVQASPATTDATTGQTLQVTVGMSQGLTLDTSGGSPTLSLSDGATATYDAAASSPSSGNLVFDYTVGSSDYSVGLTTTALNLNGATLTDSNGIAADLSAANGFGLGFDVNAAVVNTVTASQTGEVAAGAAVTLTVAMNEAVVVSTSGGSPTLALDDGATATYDAQASNPANGTLVFDYTVGSSDQSPNLQITQVNLNGATINDGNGNAADFSNALYAPTGLRVGPAFVSSVEAPSGITDATTGKTLELTVNLSQGMTLTTSGGTPTLSLSDGATATYDANASNPSSGNLVFDYTVGSSDYAVGLTTTALNLNGATLTDSSGVATDLSAANGFGLGFDVDAAVVDTVRASQTGEVAAGAAITLTLAMNEAVVVNTSSGSPTLALDDGATATYDAQASNRANGTLSFDYTVGSSDQSPNLAITQVNLNGATITDGNGNAADLSAALYAPTGLQVGAQSTPVTVTVSSPSLTVAENAAATPIGIAAPSDPDYRASQLTIAVASLPSDGTVTLADGVTPVAVGEDLSLAQLTGLAFTPTPDAIAASATFTYTATDPANNSATGTATLSIAAASSPGFDLTAVRFSVSLEAVFFVGANGSGTLEIIDTSKENAVVDTMTLSGNYADGLFTLASDGGNGTAISFTPDQDLSATAGDVVFSSVAGQPYPAYAQIYTDGVYGGADYLFTSVPIGAAYSAYVYEYSPGNDFIGSKFFYTGIAGQAYTGEEIDYDGGANVTRVAFTDDTIDPFSSYEYDYVGGVFGGSKFTYTSVPTGASYSSYEVDYDQNNNFISDKFFFTDLPGQSYTGEEEDFDAGGNLARVLLTGVTEQAYSSLELDYSAGTYTGYKAYYDIAGQSFTNEEVDVSAANAITKVVYSGLSGTPYSSVEEDYSNGALNDVVYDFMNVSGANAYAYQVTDDANGVAEQETFDNNNGSHTIVGFQANHTFTSIGDDTITGGGANETFVFNPLYGHDTITDFASYLTGAGHDTLSVSTSEFANFAALLADSQNVGGNVLISARNGDTITLDNLSTSALAANQADFAFHS